MTLVRLFLIMLTMALASVANAETWIVKRSFAFPTTDHGAIISKVLLSDKTDPVMKEGHLLLTAMVLVNSGEMNLVGVDMTLEDGYVAAFVVHLIQKKGEGNRIRMLAQTKRYPEGLMDSPERLSKWLTLSRPQKLVTDVTPDPKAPEERLIAVVFYQEASPEAGRIPPDLIAVAHEAISPKEQ